MKASGRLPRRAVFLGSASTAALLALLAALPVSCGLSTSGLSSSQSSSSGDHSSSSSGHGGDLFSSASSGMGGASSASSTGSGSSGSSSSAGGAGGAGGGAVSVTWHSWDVQSKGPPQPEMFVLDTTFKNKAIITSFQSSALDDLSVNVALSTYIPVPYPNIAHQVGGYWTTGAVAADPYVGKNVVPRGAEPSEMGNAPPPLLVLDLQLYPSQISSDNDKLIVAAFAVPRDGDYTVMDLAARRVLSGPGDHAVFKVFVGNTLIKALPQANMNTKWVKDANSYPLGALTVGELIYFAVDCAGDAERDATEISWTLTAQ